MFDEFVGRLGGEKRVFGESDSIVIKLELASNCSNFQFILHPVMLLYVQAGHRIAVRAIAILTTRQIGYFVIIFALIAKPVTNYRESIIFL